MNSERYLQRTEREIREKGSRDTYLRPVSPPVAWEGSASAATSDARPRTEPSLNNGSARMSYRKATARAQELAGAKP